MTALKGILTRLKLAKLMLITDDRADAGDLDEFADATFVGGVDLVQLRDDKARDRDLLAALEKLRTAAFRYQGLVAVYDDLELAHDFGADVLHLPDRGPTATKAKRFLHRYAIVGRSCHSEADIDAALADDDVAYLTVGPVFDGLTFFGHTPGLDLVRYVARLAPASDPKAKPWFAVGGITIGNVDEVLAAGARRIAVGRAITAAPDAGEAARVLKDRLREAWNDDPGMEHVVFGSLGEGPSFRTTAIDEGDDRRV